MQETEENIGTLSKGDGELPKITMGEMGSTGLVTLGGKIFEECQYELQWPQAIHTFKEMQKDASISAALDYVDNKVATAKWVVRTPDGAKDLDDKTSFVRQVMDDMENPWSDFIRLAGSFGRYGFSAIEKVYRLRRRGKGSKYDDGLIGIKKLAPRGQDTIDGWRWKNKDLVGLYQMVSESVNTDDYDGWGYIETESETTRKFIPRKKFLLFRHNPQKDSPYGTSPLNAVWGAWKLKNAYQESEALKTAQEINAFKVLYIPPEYLTKDASEDRKKTLEYFKNALKYAHQARESGLILPYLTDERGGKMFDFRVESITGVSSTDNNEIIERYTREILVGLFADVLAMGQAGGGSFSLADSKMTVIDLAVKARLDEIKNQLNHDLIPQLFAMNGWDTTITPYFDYELPQEYSLDDVSKFVQRIKAVGFLPINAKVVNWLMRSANIPFSVAEDIPQEELEELLQVDKSTSRSGDSLNTKTGGMSGTSDELSEEDTSISNVENA